MELWGQRLFPARRPGFVRRVRNKIVCEHFLSHKFLSPSDSLRNSQIASPATVLIAASNVLLPCPVQYPTSSSYHGNNEWTRIIVLQLVNEVDIGHATVKGSSGYITRTGYKCKDSIMCSVAFTKGL